MEGTAKSYQAELEALKTAERKSKNPKWKREVGDTLVGRILERSTFEGKFDPAERLIVEALDGSTEEGRPLAAGETRSLLCSTGSLRDWVEDESPQPGDVIAVYFAERVENQSGGEPWQDLRSKVLERGDNIPF
jgi:hypothetical protein